MKKNIILLFIITLTLSIIMMSCCGTGKCSYTNSKMSRMSNLIKKYLSCELKLDNQQKKILDETCIDINNKGKEFDPFFQKFIAELINQTDNDKFDQDKLNKISTDYQYLFDEMKTIMISGMAKLHDNLTDDQRKKLAYRLKNCYNKMQRKTNQ